MSGIVIDEAVLQRFAKATQALKIPKMLSRADARKFLLEVLTGPCNHIFQTVGATGGGSCRGSTTYQCARCWETKTVPDERRKADRRTEAA